ncbi:hypothetical protein B0H13DRAFT_2334541 [Mycena leptocephala]|nr:hypothetical protein B0H13DRAFT_2334541 [Mycena leptocephala]
MASAFGRALYCPSPVLLAASPCRGATWQWVDLLQRSYIACSDGGRLAAKNPAKAKRRWWWLRSRALIEGAITVFVGLVSFFFLPASPDKAHLLNDEERSYVKAKLKEDGAIAGDDADSFSWPEVAKAFTSIHVLIVGIIFFLSGVVLYSLAYTARSFSQSQAPAPWHRSSRPGNANNAAPHVRRTIAIAIGFIMTTSGDILATWLLGSLSPPRYTKATKILLIFSVFMCFFGALNIIYLKRENKEKAEVRAHTSRHEEAAGLGDKSAWFVYSS